MWLRLIRILLLLLVFAGLAFTAFKIYRKVKTRHEITQWLSSDHWTKRYNLFMSAPRTHGGIVFFGNSLTEKFNLSVFGDSAVINRGINGDYTEGLLKRINEVISLQPSKLFIEIGINDIFEKVSPDVIMENYEQIIARIKKGCPETKIYIQSNLPVNRSSLFTSCAALNQTIREQNEQLKMLAVKYNAAYIDLYDLFAKDGALDPRFDFDGVHITKAGYAVWKEALRPYLKD